jgi:hypothetical protein
LFSGVFFPGFRVLEKNGHFLEKCGIDVPPSSKCYLSNHLPNLLPCPAGWELLQRNGRTLITAPGRSSVGLDSAQFGMLRALTGSALYRTVLVGYRVCTSRCAGGSSRQSPFHAACRSGWFTPASHPFEQKTAGPASGVHRRLGVARHTT